MEPALGVAVASSPEADRGEGDFLLAGGTGELLPVQAVPVVAGGAAPLSLPFQLLEHLLLSLCIAIIILLLGLFLL